MPVEQEDKQDQQDQDPYYLRLDGAHGEQQSKLDLAICKLCEDAVSACADRDDELKDLRRTLEGRSDPVGNLPWPGACQLEETICRELHNTVTAAIWSAARQFPYVCLEAVDRENIDAASDVETWINIKAQQYDYDRALYDAIYLAGEGRYAPMFIGYRQDIIRSFELRDVVAAVPLTEPGEESARQPAPEQELVLSEIPGNACCDFRCPDPWDVYVWPVTARGPQIIDGCTNVLERMCLTREDLMMGVIDLGYDRNAVNEMITRGPAALYNANDGDGLDGIGGLDGLDTANVLTTREGGTWECFQVIGRAPLLPDDDGDPTIPEALLHTDCIWMCCPALHIVFKQSYSDVPDSLRPYAFHNVITVPNRMLGEGIVSISQSMSDEMTAIIRFGINNMNIEASPMMSVAESWLTRYSKWTVAPGRFLPRQSSDPVGPKPVTWDVRSQALIMPWLDRLDSKLHRMAATEGSNSALAGRVRKAAEVHFAEQMQQTKFDLFLANIQRGVKETFRIMMAIELKHMGDEGDTVNDETKGISVTVTRQQVEKKFRFLPQASTDSISPAARLAKQQVVAQIVNAYWQGFPMYHQLGNLTYMWALNHRLLILAGERSPERYIGPEPEGSAQQIPQMNPMMMQAMMGGGQAGNGQASPMNPMNGGGFDMGAGMLQASPFSPRGASGNGNGNGSY